MSLFTRIHEQVIGNFGYSAYTRASEGNHQVHWLRETMGEQGRRWDYSQAKFYFKTEQDYLLFVLRWS